MNGARCLPVSHAHSAASQSALSTRKSLDFVIIFDYIRTMTSKELKRWLEKQGATFTAGKGSHLHVKLNGKFSVLPMHNKDLGMLANAIKKQLGVK